MDMHTRHFAVLALGAIAAVFGVSNQEFNTTTQLIAALISALGIQDVIKGWKVVNNNNGNNKTPN